MNTIKERIKNKREILKQRKVYFSDLCNSQMDTKNFEQNAITELLLMQQLKSEIAELEHLEMIMQPQ